MNSKDLYKIAYELHYSEKDFDSASEIYLKVIEQFPDSPEARYASSQIQNIKEMSEETKKQAQKKVEAHDPTMTVERNEPMERHSLEETLQIAKAQKGVLWCILINMICFFIPFAFLVVLPFQMIYIYKLAKSLKVGPPVLWLLGMLVPILSLILLLVLSLRATEAIRAAGFKVGLMGSKIKEIESRMRGQVPPEFPRETQQAAVSDNERKSEQRLEILADYGQYIEMNPEPVLRDTSELPHPKEVILDAILQEIIHGPNERKLEILKIGAIMLADFQDNVGSKPLTGIGVSIDELRSGMSCDKKKQEELLKKIANNPEKEKYELFKKLAEKDLRMIESKVRAAETLRK